MYRILLADDEGIMLMSLRKIIEGNFEGDFEIETAKTGTMAVSMALNFHPDIVFMDIHMPGINGIDAIKEIKEKYPDILFVVITAYDKFDYAKEALSLKVFEFIMKPVSKSMVIDIVNRCIAKIQMERKNRMDNLKIREKLDTVIPILENGFISNIILPDAPEVEVEHYRELLEITQDNAYIIMLQFGEENKDEILTNTVGMGVRAQRYYGKMRETICEYFDAVVGPIAGNSIIIYIPCEKDNISYDERVKIIEDAREMRKALSQVFDAKFRVGIGGPKNILLQAQSLYEAKRALSDGKSRIAHFEDLPEISQQNTDYPVDTEEKIYDFLQQNEEEKMVEQVEKLFMWYQQNRQNELNEVRMKGIEIAITASRESRSLIKDTKGVMESDYLKEVMECQDVFGVQNWIETKLIAMLRSQNNLSKTETAIEKAILYIRDNYDKDISLNDVAEVVNISPYYFSKLFKEEKGTNFIDYITKIRIERAKELLKDPERSIKEVCVLSGYANPNYFSRIFKKQEGITPTEFREKYVM